MNILLTIGLLLIIGYSAGWLLDKIGLPKIIGYIVTGIILSPNTTDFIDGEFIENTSPLMDICLTFIAFEVGGALKWSKIKKHEKEIISITLLASFFPFILITAAIIVLGFIFPAILPLAPLSLILLAILLGALSSPTDPTATFAIMHQYKAKGKVSDTIIGVAALDDVIGILIFSITIGVISITNGNYEGVFGNPIAFSIYQIGLSILIGAAIGYSFCLISKIIKSISEGQWVVIVFSLLIFSAGISKLLDTDEILSSMTMGMVVVNRCKKQKIIFRILERYTEEIIFLFFFLLSGLHLDISSIPKATSLILIFVIFRTVGKYLGVSTGARMVKADPKIGKYTAGGLIPQGGIVIGLVLSIYQDPQFKEISEILLTTIMGAIIIHELIGPVITKNSLKKAGELKKNKKRHN